MHKSRIDRRRRHSAELRAQVLAACAEPGASIAQVALSHGLNANLVYKWRRLTASECGRVSKSVVVAPRNDFVSIPILPANDIRVAIRLKRPANPSFPQCADLLPRIILDRRVTLALGIPTLYLIWWPAFH